MKNKERGTTLLELVMALFVFSIVIFASVNTISFVLSRTSQIQYKVEQNFNVNLAMSSLLMHINEATEFNLTTMGGSLHRLRLYGGHTNPNMERIFDFVPHEGTLRFGGAVRGTSGSVQVLASYIKDVTITVNNNLMSVSVVSEYTRLNRIIDIRHLNEF